MTCNAECMLCLLRRHVATARLHGTDEQVTAFAKELMSILAESPASVSSPYHTPAITALFTKHFGLPDDRYAEEKRLSNRYVMERLERIQSLVAGEPDRLYAGLQWAILGNYIDFSALQGEVSLEYLDELLPKASAFQVDKGAFADFRRDLSGAKTLLYLTDNAGEIGFDRVFAQEIQREFPELAITFCVRGGPAQNDATREDAEAVALPFPVIDNGSRIPGTVLSCASEDLLSAMERSDVVLAKGQANVETLLDTGHGKNLYYAFLIKCQRFIDRFQKPKMTPMFVRERTVAH